MQLNDLLSARNISSEDVVVMRHRPTEPGLRKVLPWLAAERPEVFNAYQKTQRERAERALIRAKYLASFIGHEAGKAVFIGLYEMRGAKKITVEEFWAAPEIVAMERFGLRGIREGDGRSKVVWFDLHLSSLFSEWKGKLVVRWPPPERAWWRWANRNIISVEAIHPESILDQAMPDWDKIVMTWEELKAMPSSWRARLSQWRGIYFIFDVASQKGYVGSASGKENILGRWSDYAKSSHGGNKQLRLCDPKNLRFSILQRVSPDLDKIDVVEFESGWKMRLFTREYGLNDN